MTKKKILICGATGFIGKNLLLHFLQEPDYEIYATHYRAEPLKEFAKNPSIQFLKADLTRKEEVEKVVEGMDILIQAAATTSGAKDIVTRPYLHVADNAVMNSHLFRAAYDFKIKHVVFFSCTVMYREQTEPVKEEDFDYQIVEKYYGVGWTKVYLEKMAEFYSRISPTKYTAIRHSNIYGPHDKYDLEKSHVFGATVAKVMNAQEGKISVWGDGSEERDLLYVDDLVRFTDLVLKKQECPFELLNLAYGQSISVLDLVKKIIQYSGRNLQIEFDRNKPTLPYKLSINSECARKRYGWSPQISLDEGIQKSLEWYEKYYASKICV
jgi:nucleoside-diphosphate-sugar epimerase